jgi:preprotein translocase subunit SecD
MLRFQPWKTWTVIIVCLLGVLLALPNAVPTSVLDALPSWVPAHKVSLGLDLQGGSHLLYEVDMSAVAKDRMESTLEGVRTELLKAKIGYTALTVEGDHIALTLREPGDVDRVAPVLKQVDPELQLQPPTSSGPMAIAYSPQALETRKRSIIDQSIEIIRRRIDETGTKEPTIIAEGADRVLVQLPGIDDPERVKAIIGKTAKMTFRLVDTTASLEDAKRGKLPPGDEYLPYDPSNELAAARGGVVVKKRITVDGGNLVDAQSTFQDNQPVISIKFDSIGGRRFGDMTKDNVGKPFAIVLDNKVLSDPVIREPIPGGSGVISGSFTVKSATDLALLLRAGALPAPLKIIEERTVGPDLGADSIRAGTIASVIAMILVTLFMIAFYGLFGLYADIALVFNVAILLGALSLLGATLTLPGIAGMALTMGMAVDANVLVNERIREEIRNGRTMLSAIDNGFTKAYATITDANVTHFIAGAFLFFLGAGPVKGFAVTLCLGIATSLFTTMMVTRLFIVWWLRTRPRVLPI